MQLFWSFAVLLLCCLPIDGRADEPSKGGVLFDFNVKPQEKDIDIAMTVEFADSGGETWSFGYRGFFFDLEDFAFLTHDNLKTCKVKAEIVDKTKVRVLGVQKNGKFYPAVLGTMKSKSIPLKDLPKVINPPKA